MGEETLFFYQEKAGGFLGRGSWDISRILSESPHVTRGSDTDPSAGLPGKQSGLGAPTRKDFEENESF